MVMEFDQYLQPCDADDTRFRVVYDAVTRPRPLLEVYRASSTGPAAAAAEVESPQRPGSPSKEVQPAADQCGSTRENRCKWECNFDNDDAETILTSHTVTDSCLLTIFTSVFFYIFNLFYWNGTNM